MKSIFSTRKLSFSDACKLGRALQAANPGSEVYSVENRAGETTAIVVETADFDEV